MFSQDSDNYYYSIDDSGHIEGRKYGIGYIVRSKKLRINVGWLLLDILDELDGDLRWRGRHDIVDRKITIDGDVRMYSFCFYYNTQNNKLIIRKREFKEKYIDLAYFNYKLDKALIK